MACETLKVDGTPTECLLTFGRNFKDGTALRKRQETVNAGLSVLAYVNNQFPDRSPIVGDSAPPDIDVQDDAAVGAALVGAAESAGRFGADEEAGPTGFIPPWAIPIIVNLLLKLFS